MQEHLTQLDSFNKSKERIFSQFSQRLFSFPGFFSHRFPIQLHTYLRTKMCESATPPLDTHLSPLIHSFRWTVILPKHCITCVTSSNVEVLCTRACGTPSIGAVGLDWTYRRFQIPRLPLKSTGKSCTCTWQSQIFTKGVSKQGLHLSCRFSIRRTSRRLTQSKADNSTVCSLHLSDGTTSTAFANLVIFVVVFHLQWQGCWSHFFTGRKLCLQIC